ncbi:hypothetical protein GWI33_006078 [Rhynchophorus ferrugineus]|uniref:Kinetochore protein Spc24 n=1 Tax=Rhynchophorus ferrugineus TaxID=354439 RepID=A0A834IFM8_RHYFE|nr:hypothetical protein GWI33_006078 [Rhynchophorus ferrugineus]
MYESKFNERFSQFEILYDKLLYGVLSDTELHKDANIFKSTQFSNLQHYESVVDKNKLFLEKKENSVTKLEAQKAQKEEELEKLAILAENEEQKITSTKSIQDEISKKKDQILTYKLLTKANFLYTGKKVTGYMASKSPRTFTFDPQETSQEEITEALWKLTIEDSS